MLIAFVVALALSGVMWLAARGPALATALAGHPASTDTPARLVGRQAIVAAQVGVAFSLLVGAALMMRSAWHLATLDLGFEPRGVLSTNVTVADTAYPSLAARREFFRTLIARLEELPEVERAGLTGWLPFRVGPQITVYREGSDAAPHAAVMQGVDAGYFDALHLRLVDGRLLAGDDREGRPRVAVVSESLARLLAPGASAVGTAFRIKFAPDAGRGFGPYTVVGVVGDVLQSVIRPTPPQMYLAFHQQPLASNGFLQLKTIGPPLSAAPAVARVVHEMNPELAVGSVTSLDAIVDADAARPRRLAAALAGFSILALAIATAGLYVVSVWIAQSRQREAALRVVLGARHASVAALLARRGLIAVAAGLVLGWLAAAPLSASISAELWGVSATDPSTRIVVAAVLALLSIAALLAPAWRAATADLATVLRND
jgi:hypothetical protein